MMVILYMIKFIFYLFFSILRINILHAQETESDLISFSNGKIWTKYLHLNSNNISKIKSDSNFFFAKDGFKNPLSELKNSIDTFRHPEPFLQKNLGHPECLFPARLKILKKYFKISPKTVNCPAYDNWVKATKTKDVQIIFASQFVNNPASVMGHTFIKFKNNDSSDYLNLYLGYAAEVPDNTNALKYFYKGLSGGFQGVFNDGPYYQKVYEYNDIEQRDIWEYTLKLTNEQKNYLSDHIWELRNTAKFDYYFFNRNCSYMLLEILNTVIIDKNLIPNDTFIIPHETLKLLNRMNLLDDEKYLPSIRSNLVHKYEQLNSSEQQDTIKIISSKHLNGNENSRILDTLIDYNLISFQKNKKINANFKDTDFSQQTLILRSKINKPEDFRSNVSIPPSPLKAHPPHQFSISVGRQNNGKTFYSLILNPGIHQVMDKSDGFVANSNFNFLSPEFRYREDQKKPYLSSFKLIEFSSLNPYTSIDPKFSWGIRLFYQKNESNDCLGCSSLNALMFVGYSFQKNQSSSFNLFPSLEFIHTVTPQEKNDALIGAIAEYIYEKGKYKFLINESIQQGIRSYQVTPVIYSTTLRYKIYNIFNNNDLESKILFKKFSSMFKSYVELSLGYIVLW